MKIEKGIVIPKLGEARGRPEKYPFGQMDIGDSIFFSNQPKGGQSNPAMAARMYAKRRGWSVTVRSVDGGVRVWRTA